jgi:hypothetical protein
MSGRSWTLLVIGLSLLVIIGDLYYKHHASSWFFIIPIVILVGFWISVADELFFHVR